MEDLLDDLNGQLSDLGLDGSFDDAALSDNSASGLAATTFQQLSGAIVQARAALGLPAIALPAASNFSAQSVAQFAASAGCCYTGAAAASLPHLLQFLASELQSLRVGLSRAHRAAKTQAEAAAGPSTDVQLHMMCRMLSIPVGGEAEMRSHPAKYVSQAIAKTGWLLAKVGSSGSMPASLLLDDAAPSSQRLLQGASASDVAQIMGALSEMNGVLRDEYATRREMLLKRVDVTIQSFLWSRKAQGREGEIASSIAHRRKALTSAPAIVKPEDALEAGVYLADWYGRKVTDTASRGLRSSAVKSVRIGAVPDRGGRVEEMRPSARDIMPAWQARKQVRKEEAAAGGGGGGGQRGGRGGGAFGAGAGKHGRDHDRQQQQRPQSAAAGGAGSKQYDKEHDERAKAILRDAKRFEGEAGAALEELEAETADDHDADGDHHGDGMDVDGGSGAGSGGNGGGGGEKKYWRKEKGAGGRGGHRGGRGGGSGR